MKVTVVQVTAFQQNCSILVDEASGRAAVVDPGGDVDLIVQALGETGGELEKIFITHGHIDHCGGAAELRRRTGVPIEGPHEDDRFWIDQLAESGTRFGISGLEPFTPDRWLKGGDTVQFGETVLEVRHCPGHTPGHIIYFSKAERLAIVGDVLFQGSVGRTDLPGGDHATLIRSITGELWPLGNDVVFIPGHGPASRFDQERKTNPFVSDQALERL